MKNQAQITPTAPSSGKIRIVSREILIPFILLTTLFAQIQGYISDQTGRIETAYYVPMFAFAMVLAYALFVRPRDQCENA